VEERAFLTAGCAFVAVCLGGVSLAGYALAKYGSIQRYNDLHIDPAPAGDPENDLVDAVGGVPAGPTWW
jgi:hypothetical protein